MTETVDDILDEAMSTGDMLERTMGKERYDKVFRVMHGECSDKQCSKTETKKYTIMIPAKNPYTMVTLCAEHVKPFIESGLVIRQE